MKNFKLLLTTLFILLLLPAYFQPLHARGTEEHGRGGERNFNQRNKADYEHRDNRAAYDRGLNRGANAGAAAGPSSGNTVIYESQPSVYNSSAPSQ